MSLITDTLNACKDANTKAVIPFLTANFPNRDLFNAMLHKLPEHGATIIEIGIPFSDPMADGSTIQKTSEAAIAHGFRMDDCLVDIQTFKEAYPHIPIVIMTYANPIIQYGTEAWCTDAANAGVSGLLAVDVPPESAEKLFPSSMPLDMIRLVTATTDMARLPVIQDGAGGFIYYVSIKGVTGTAAPDPTIVADHLSMLRQHIQLPVVIGFGISSPEIAADMAQISDGVVIGSSLIRPFLDAPESDYNQIMTEQLQYLQSIHTHIHA